MCVNWNELQYLVCSCNRLQRLLPGVWLLLQLNWMYQFISTNTVFIVITFKAATPPIISTWIYTAAVGAKLLLDGNHTQATYILAIWLKRFPKTTLGCPLPSSSQVNKQISVSLYSFCLCLLNSYSSFYIPLGSFPSQSVLQVYSLKVTDRHT